MYCDTCKGIGDKSLIPVVFKAHDSLMVLVVFCLHRQDGGKDSQAAAPTNSMPVCSFSPILSRFFNGKQTSDFVVCKRSGAGGSGLNLIRSFRSGSA